MGSTQKISPAGLRQQVLEIESRVGFNAPISAVQEKKLFRQLDRVQSSVEQLQGSNIAFLEDLPDKITQLYGTIHNRAIDTQVEKFVSDAKHLQTELESGKDIDQGVGRLQKKIQQIRKQHALGAENLKVAGYVASRTKHYLEARSLGQQAPQLVNQFNLLEIQKLHYQGEEMDDQLNNELFEIAEGYYLGRTKDLMKRYHLLPERAKERVKVHFERLGIASPAEDKVRAAQAFIATAYDIAAGEDNEPYFSESELKSLFAEAHMSGSI